MQIEIMLLFLSNIEPFSWWCCNNFPILTANDKNEQPCLLPNLRGKAFSISSSMLSAVDFSYIFFIRLKKFSSVSSLWNIFYNVCVSNFYQLFFIHLLRWSCVFCSLLYYCGYIIIIIINYRNWFWEVKPTLFLS